jgi:predicted phage terminase large subunit-like protein
MSEKLVHEALRNPRRALIELDRIDCGQSFYEFVRMAWHVLEPVHPFVGGWAVKAICDSLQAVTEGKIRRLIINVPPGCTKSMTTSVFWPAWEWGPKGMKHHRFINGSYEKGLSTRDLVRCRDLLMSTWYQERWPLALKQDQDQKTYYENEGTGWRLATSVGGALTGYRGDRIVVDDPHDVKRAESDTQRAEALRWWTEVVPTRVNKAEESAIVLMMQRLHANDLSGHTIRSEGDEWAKLILPMEYEDGRKCVLPEIGFEDPRTIDGELLWEERFPRSSVDRLKRTLRSRGGDYAVAGQLQQRPVAREGGLFKREHAKFLDFAPELVRVVRGWDLAATDDNRAAFTAGVKMGITSDGKIVIMNSRRGQLEPLGVKQLIQGTAREDGHSVYHSVPQDPGAAGKVVKAHIATYLHGYNVHFSAESGDKVSRAEPLAAQWAAGNVYIVRGDWNEEFLGELAEFPNSEFKDQVDAASRGYGYLITHTVDDDIGTTAGLVSG